jgi:hypothetical protein
MPLYEPFFVVTVDPEYLGLDLSSVEANAEQARQTTLMIQEKCMATELVQARDLWRTEEPASVWGIVDALLCSI